MRSAIAKLSFRYLKDLLNLPPDVDIQSVHVTADDLATKTITLVLAGALPEACEDGPGKIRAVVSLKGRSIKAFVVEGIAVNTPAGNIEAGALKKFLVGKPSKPETPEGALSVSSVTEIPRDGYICNECATKLGGLVPEGLVCTAHRARCPICNETATLRNVGDWDWPDGTPRGMRD